MSLKPTTARVTWVGLLTIVLLAVGSSSVLAKGFDRVVRFHGYRMQVPSSWPVYDLARSPDTCVRFNRHALYLGTPGANQRCPAYAIGRTEAILLEPVSAGAASARSARGGIVGAVGSVTRFVVPAAGLAVMATWSRDRGLVSRILGRRVHGSSVVTSSPARGSSPVRAPEASLPPASARRALARPAASARATSAPSTAFGFDACFAPSTSEMSAWSSSPFRTIGVYIGGVNAACKSQPNLTASWVSTEIAAGWRLIPTYVGLQGAGSCGGCALISPSQATAEGEAAATDAVNQAQAIGIRPGNPIYDDMEQYSRSSSNSAAVLAYLAGWTTQLHAEGYLSGVYSSASSGITDLVGQSGTAYTEPDDIWVADWNSEQTTNDPYVPSGDWANNQRLHQYNGGYNATYGGVTINIDGDYIGGATAGTIPDGTFVEVAGANPVYRIAGGAPLYVSSWTPFGTPQPVETITPQQFSELAPYPLNGTFITSTTGSTTTPGPTYRVAGGAPLEVYNPAIYGAAPVGVSVDAWNLQNISSPLSHLQTAPADGTIVEGLPSDTYWSFCGGFRSSVPADPAAVGVDDQALAAFPISATTTCADTGGTAPRTTVTITCVVPRLKHMSLVRARSALRRAHCRLGKVRRPRRWGRFHLLHVYGQSTRPRSKHPDRYRVNIRLI